VERLCEQVCVCVHRRVYDVVRICTWACVSIWREGDWGVD
jgi:hypothetical protein